jgi:predicted DNA-binding protein (MmcQ/YjbR family)
MNIEELHEYCLSMQEATDSLPFDDVSLVMKVRGKMFALIPLDSPVLQISLKCDSEQAVELRERYACVEPAYHFNKKYWNTIYPNRDMPDEVVKKWIRHSVDEVIKKLPKRIQTEYYDSKKHQNQGSRPDKSPAKKTKQKTSL